MKTFIKSTILIVLALVCTLCFIACQPSATQPKKLDAPIVTLSGNVVSWEGNQNAERFEISIDGSLSFVENTVTSKTLTNGQTIKVRAIGDGATYQTICDTLNKHGKTNRSGTKFSISTLQVIIDNKPLYEGMYRYGKDGDWVQGEHEPILKGE